MARPRRRRPAPPTPPEHTAPDMVAAVRAAIAAWDENPASWSPIHERLVADYGDALNATLTAEWRAHRRRVLLADDGPR